MKIKKTTLYFGALIILVGVLAFFLLSGKDSSVTGNVVNAQQVAGKTQRVIVGMKDFNYYPNTINVKANQQVELSLDSSVTGCLRSFTIRELNVQKHLRTPDETLTFTPTQKGIYTFSCSMGMGSGKLIVE